MIVEPPKWYTIMISLHSSSFAAFVGRHPYVKQHEAFEKTWERAFPESYSAALTRHGRVTDQECLRLVRSKVPEVDITLHAAETTVSNSATAVLEGREELSGEICGEHMSAREKKLVGDEIRKQLFTQYGIAQEQPVLDILRDRMDMKLISVDEKYMKNFVTANGVPWKLVGRIDACTTDKTTIIEVKNRVNRLFMHATEYERIQVECYLRLIDEAERAFLVESLHVEGAGRTINIIPIERDESHWKEICHLAEMYVEYVHRIAHDTHIQDIYFESKRPSAFLRKVTE